MRELQRAHHPKICAQLDAILEVYATDNYSAWDCQPDSSYIRRYPAEGEQPRASQEVLISRTEGKRKPRAVAASPPDREALPVPIDEL